MENLSSLISNQERLVSENLNNGENLYKLAQLYIKEGNFQKAIKVLEKCSKMPNGNNAKYLMGIIYLLEGGLGYAFKALQTVTDEDGDFCFNKVDKTGLPPQNLIYKSLENFENSENLVNIEKNFKLFTEIECKTTDNSSVNIYIFNQI